MSTQPPHSISAILAPYQLLHHNSCDIGQACLCPGCQAIHADAQQGRAWCNKALEASNQAVFVPRYLPAFAAAVCWGHVMQYFVHCCCAAAALASTKVHRLSTPAAAAAGAGRAQGTWPCMGHGHGAALHGRALLGTATTGTCANMIKGTRSRP